MICPKYPGHTCLPTARSIRKPKVLFVATPLLEEAGAQQNVKQQSAAQLHSPATLAQIGELEWASGRWMIKVIGNKNTRAYWLKGKPQMNDSVMVLVTMARAFANVVRYSKRQWFNYLGEFLKNNNMTGRFRLPMHLYPTITIIIIIVTITIILILYFDISYVKSHRL